MTRNATGFSVQKWNEGASNVGFSWRVVARRKDVRAARLAKFNVLKMQAPAHRKP
jgi:hypothetical protein